VAFGGRFDRVGEQIAMRPRTQRAIDMHRLPMHATQRVQIQIESAFDFPLMARAKEMHERHAIAPAVESPLRPTSRADASDVRRSCGTKIFCKKQKTIRARETANQSRSSAQRYCHDAIPLEC
jgi:hypothetical protein